MSQEVLRQEIEIKARDWKKEYDEAAQIEFELSKAKELRDNTAGIIIGKMKQLGVTEFKAPGINLTLADGTLSLANHSARAVDKKPTRGKKKDVLEA